MASPNYNALTGEGEHPFTYPLGLQLSDFASESVIVSERATVSFSIGMLLRKPFMDGRPWP